MMHDLNYNARKTISNYWIDKIPNHWTYTRLKYLTKFVNGYAFKAEQYASVGIPIIRIGDIQDEVNLDRCKYWDEESANNLREYEVKNGDLLLALTGATIGKSMTYRSDKSALLNQRCAILKPSEYLLNAFLSYLVKSVGFLEYIKLECDGGAQENIGKPEVGNFSICLPTVDEQESIASFLDHKTAQIDNLIAEKERLLKLLEEKRIALITRAVTKGLDPNVKMKPSGIDWLGDIPEHWEIVKLKRLLKKKKDAIKTGPFGSQLISTDMVGGEIKVYNQRNVLDNNFNSGDDFISLDKFEELKAFETFPGDILITTRGTIGRCAILPQAAERGILHPSLMRIQVESVIEPEYLLNLFQNSNLMLEQVLLENNATTIPVIYSETLKELVLPLPPIKEQFKLLSLISSQLNKFQILQIAIVEAIVKLKEYRISLITAAVTGKIDVRDFTPEEEHEKVH